MAAAATNPHLLPMPGIGVLAAGSPDAGEALVYLHGWGASKDLWWNTMAGLADHGHGYALDLPGTGETPLGHRFESMAQLAAWTVLACERLKVTRATFIGHSLGGNLAAQIALDHPGFVARLILVDAALATESLPRRVYWTQSAVYGLHAIRVTRAASTPLATAGRNVPHDHTGGFWGPLARRAGMLVSANKSDAALQMQLKILCRNPLTIERLRSIEAPILIVHGGLDGVIPIATAKAYAGGLPGCELKVFPASHHCPMDHDPRGFVQTLREFINTHPASAERQAASMPAP